MFFKIATGSTLLGLLLGGFLTILEEFFIWVRLAPGSFLGYRILGILVPLVIYVPLMMFVVAVFMKLNKEES